MAVKDKSTNIASPDAPGRDVRERGPLHRRLHAHPALSVTTKVVVGLVGAVVLAVGVVMLVTPGPAFVLIPLGLAILATEFDWAHRWLEKARAKAHQARLRAAAVDPKVRRRRLALATVGAVALVGGVGGYVAAYDWPAFAVAGWDAVQSLVGWAPELPGM